MRKAPIWPNRSRLNRTVVSGSAAATAIASQGLPPDRVQLLAVQDRLAADQVDVQVDKSAGAVQKQRRAKYQQATGEDTERDGGACRTHVRERVLGLSRHVGPPRRRRRGADRAPKLFPHSKEGRVLVTLGVGLAERSG